MKKLLKAVLKGFLIVFAISIFFMLVGLFGTFVYSLFDYIATVNEWSEEARQLVGVIAVAFFGSWAMIAFLDYSDPMNED